MRTAAIIFEGGPPAENPLQESLVGLRHAVTLDTVAKFCAAGLDQVVPATNHGALAEAAARLGARILRRGGPRFTSGKPPAGGAGERRDAVIYLSGAALPLIGQEEIAWIRAAERNEPTVVVNNVQSVDLVAWQPAAHLERVDPPENDNFLGWLLRETGMERVLLPNSAAVNFDLDTPTDYLILALSGRGGPRARAALRGGGLARPPPAGCGRRAGNGASRGGPHHGRVGSAIMEHFNRNLPVRLRVFSEERGNEGPGAGGCGAGARAVVADLVEDLGPERFFARLSETCDAAFFDTRWSLC